MNAELEEGMRMLSRCCLGAEALHILTILLRTATVADVLGVVAAALRTEQGSVMALRQRQAADEVEAAGAKITAEYGV